MERISDRSSRETLGEVVVEGQPRPVEIDPRAGRLEIRVGDDAAFVVFEVEGSVLALDHTEVPKRLRGQGLADTLARAALEYARTHGMTVKPYCPFVAGYVKRHPAYRGLVDPAFPALS